MTKKRAHNFWLVRRILLGWALVLIAAGPSFALDCVLCGGELTSDESHVLLEAMWPAHVGCQYLHSLGQGAQDWAETRVDSTGTTGAASVEDLGDGLFDRYKFPSHDAFVLETHRWKLESFLLFGSTVSAVHAYSDAVKDSVPPAFAALGPMYRIASQDQQNLVFSSPSRTKMTFSEAGRFCSAFGGDSRLPSPEEYHLFAAALGSEIFRFGFLSYFTGQSWASSERPGELPRAISIERDVLGRPRVFVEGDGVLTPRAARCVLKRQNF